MPGKEILRIGVIKIVIILDFINSSKTGKMWKNEIKKRRVCAVNLCYPFVVTVRLLADS